MLGERKQDRKNLPRILSCQPCAGVKGSGIRSISDNSKIENTRKQGMDQRGVPEVLSCGGHFWQRNTKTVVIKHHARKMRGQAFTIWMDQCEHEDGQE